MRAPRCDRVGARLATALLVLAACQAGALPAGVVQPPSPAAPGPFRIHDIQGAGHISPLQFRLVPNVPGIVTAKRDNGFWMQDPEPDADPRTSEGIFVATVAPPRSVSVGDAVLVTGRVAEERRGGNAALTATLLSGPTIIKVSSGNPLPSPVVLGVGGRVPPDVVVENDASEVEQDGVFDPDEDGIDFYESLEGMLVQVNEAVAVGPTTRFGEVAVVGDVGSRASVRTPRGGLLLRPDDRNPERITIDDEVLLALGQRMPKVDVADRAVAPIVGVLDYTFGNFKVEATALPRFAAAGLRRESAEPPRADQLSVATLNTENLDPTDPAAKFDGIARIIVQNLQAPDLISLEEIQDNSGAKNDGTVDASLTYRTLIGAIQRVGGPAYDFRDIPPVDGQDGGEPGGNIRVGFLFRTDRGLSFVDRPGGGPTTVVAVVRGPAGAELSSSPGRVQPAHRAFSNSRKPLAAEFTFRGQRLFLVANHFLAKSGDDPIFGRYQPPGASSEEKRVEQARICHEFARALLAIEPAANVILLGDFNDFEFSRTLLALKGGLLHDLVEALPPTERYTYVFEGNSQVLDHTLVSESLFRVPFEFRIVHVNAEFADQASDHEPLLARFTLRQGGPP